MELKRKVYDKLLEWKNQSNGKTSLLVEGARRIGKSTIVKKFGEEQYDSYVLIDFSKASKTIKDNFDNLDNLDKFYQTIMLEYNVRLYIRKSLIIFDEIQKFPKAREALKHLVLDGRYDFVETGSLISIKENVSDIIIPSEEEKIKMYPLDFEEFLWASNEHILLDYIKECYKNNVQLDDSYHKKASSLFREYMLVGGMPQSVVAYFENNKDFYESDKAKRLILSMYEDDIKKAAKKYKYKVAAIFENIPGYLSTHEKKIVLSEIGVNKTFNMYSESLFWLEDSMICNLCYKCNDPNVGFALNRNESEVKCYMGDTGLLVSLAFSENEISNNQLYKNIMNGKLSLNEGMLYENLIAQTLVANGKKLYFYNHYSKEKHRNDIEIDFLISNESKTNIKVYPIEVKSSKNYSNSSYDKFKLKFGKKIGESYIVHPKGYQKYENGIKIPSYMFFCLFDKQ